MAYPMMHGVFLLIYNLSGVRNTVTNYVVNKGYYRSPEQLDSTETTEVLFFSLLDCFPTQC